MFTYKARRVSLANIAHQKVFNFPDSSSMIHGNPENLRFYYQLFIFLISWFIFLPASSIQITELMYNPPNRGNEETMEFIELYNEKADYLDLGEWKFVNKELMEVPEPLVLSKLDTSSILIMPWLDLQGGNQRILGEALALLHQKSMKKSMRKSMPKK